MKNILITVIVTILFVLVILFSLSNRINEHFNNLKPITIRDTIRDTIKINRIITLKDTVYNAIIDTITVVVKDSTINEVVANGFVFINQKDISGVIKIRYNFDQHNFNLLKSTLNYSGEIVTNTITVEKIIPNKIKLLSPVVMIGISYNNNNNFIVTNDSEILIDNNKYSGTIGFGVRIYQKYDVLFKLNSKTGVGISFIYQF